jgi:NAD(P)-dependent dehydrogenase (short-subunit alcohol dehydrogenase family)
MGRPLDLEDRVALITGAAGGIGSALTHRLLAEGARVAALDLDASRLDELEADAGAGERLRSVAVDLTNAGAVHDAVDRLVATWGGVDLLFNNAGLSHHSRFVETRPEVLERVMGVNFWAAVHVTRAALPSLIERGGQIVVMSSVAGFAPLLERCAYAASKHALHGLFETLAAELRDSGVHVLLVCPSFVRTDIDRRALRADGTAGVPAKAVSGRVLEPEELADRILAALARRRRRLIPSPTARLSLLLTSLFPGLYERLMVRSMERR